MALKNGVSVQVSLTGMPCLCISCLQSSGVIPVKWKIELAQMAETLVRPKCTQSSVPEIPPA